MHGYVCLGSIFEATATAIFSSAQKATMPGPVKHLKQAEQGSRPHTKIRYFLRLALAH
jgi:hypothetical protein